MAIVIKMPKLSDTMETGTILNWTKQVGDEIEPGDVLAEVESDKATMELEAYDPGFLRELLVDANESVPVDTPLAIVSEDADEDISETLAGLKSDDGGESKPEAEAKQEEAPQAEPAPEPTPEPEPEPEPAPAPSAVADEPVPHERPSGSGGRVLASPVAAQMAMQNGLDLSMVRGTGPGGRIVKRDVEAALENRSSTPSPVGMIPATTAPRQISPDKEFVDTPNSNMRKVIAKRLTESKTQIPHYYLTIECDMAQAVALRKQLNALEGVKVSVNDFVIKAVALALANNPAMNSSFQGEFIRTYNRIDIGVAVAMEDGLITPVVRDAGNKGLREISEEVKELAGRARNKKLKTDEFTGSTFTVSNLGMHGVKHFTAVINPPEAGILAVGAVQEIPVVEDGEVTVGHRMNVTLSSDHRVVDGAQSAIFLRDFKYFIENPITFAL